MTSNFSSYAEKFKCIGGDCPDTCCKVWEMQIFKPTIDLYKAKAPELLDFIEEGASGHIMKKGGEARKCLKLKDDGYCGIHSEYGEDFLGDACYFYPRVIRKIGNESYNNVALSCPEALRIALETEYGISQITPDNRKPTNLPSYSESYTAVTDTHMAFIELCRDETIDISGVLLRLLTIGRSLSMISEDTWPQAVPFYIKFSESRILEPEYDELAPLKLINMIAILVKASNQKPSERFFAAFNYLQSAYGFSVDWENCQIVGGFDGISNEEVEIKSHPYLRKILIAHLAQNMFPFAGMGKDATERTVMIGLKISLLNILINSLPNENYASTEVIDIVQPVLRFIDHLENTDLINKIIEEYGWQIESRLNGVIINCMKMRRTSAI